MDPTQFAIQLAERMKSARFQLSAVRREQVSQAKMAETVSAITGRTIHQTQWGRYETGESEPPLDVIRATAVASGMDEVWLAFGYERFPKDISDVPRPQIVELLNTILKRVEAAAEDVEEPETPQPIRRKTVRPKPSPDSKEA